MWVVNQFSAHQRPSCPEAVYWKLINRIRWNWVEFVANSLNSPRLMLPMTSTMGEASAQLFRSKVRWITKVVVFVPVGSDTAYLTAMLLSV